MEVASGALHKIFIHMSRSDTVFDRGRLWYLEDRGRLWYLKLTSALRGVAVQQTAIPSKLAVSVYMDDAIRDAFGVRSRAGGIP